MKITKTQLKQIIKEEIAKLPNEPPVQDLLKELRSAMDWIHTAVESDPTVTNPEEATANLILSEVEGFLKSIGVHGIDLKY